MSNLFLILKKEYFIQIQEGTKTVEYREATPYWMNRFNKKYDTVTFQLGYSKNAPRIDKEIEKVELEEITHPFFGEKTVDVIAVYLK